MRVQLIDSLLYLQKIIQLSDIQTSKPISATTCSQDEELFVLSTNAKTSERLYSPTGLPLLSVKQAF